MAGVVPARMTARIEGDFVVFLIGMRVNKPWKIHRRYPVASAMRRMLQEVSALDPVHGFWALRGLGFCPAAMLAEF